MFTVVNKRLWHNPGLTLSTLAGMICVLAITVCVPLFSHAVSREMLHQQLVERAAQTERSLFCMRIYYNDDDPPYVLDVDTSKRLAEHIAARATSLTGLPIKQVVMNIRSRWWSMKPITTGLYGDPDRPLARLRFMSMEMVPEHAQLVEGTWPVPNTSASEPIQVALHETLANEMGLNVGERYLMGSDFVIEIAGVWKAIDPKGEVWFYKPSSVFFEILWIPEETYRARLDGLLANSVFSTSWYVMMDERYVRFEQAPLYAQGIKRLDVELSNLLPGIRMDYSPYELLMTYQERVNSLTRLLSPIGAPMIVLALLFIGLTSNIAIQERAQEVATMRSRGTSRPQVALINLVESVILIVFALPLSLVAGWLAANAMSQTLSFLEFTSRPPLTFSYGGLNIPLLSIAVVCLVGARFFPALGASRRTIVRMKQEQARGMIKPLWQRLYLDFFLLLPGTYAYLILRGWGERTKFVPRAQLSDEPFRDPLLFVAPALFAMGTCVVLSRLVPLLARVVAALVERLPGVWEYLSLQHVARQPQDHASALVLIMISLSLAIFAASSARTLDQWLLDSIYYSTGADLTVREMPPQEEMGMAGGGPGEDRDSTADATSGITLADLGMTSDWFFTKEQHLKLPGVEHATRVGKYGGTFSTGRTEQPCRIMGIDRLEFPQVAFFRTDFASVSLGALMNALGAEPRGVLIPSYVAAERGLSIGDHLAVAVRVEDLALERDFVVVGTYDYFPTVYPEKRPTFVANLDYVFGHPDAVPRYDIWLDLADGTEVRAVTDEIRRRMHMLVAVKGDAFAAIKQGQDQVERVGLFGVLNVGFLTAGLMPGIGFLLYSYASLRRRFIELGILQAIGLSVGQLVGYLVSEQLLLMGLAIAGGAAAGLMTSHLFVPFLQTGAAPGVPVPPFQVLVGWAETGWLSLGFGIVLLVTMLGTIAYLVRLEMFQAVKLGEAL